MLGTDRFADRYKSGSSYQNETATNYYNDFLSAYRLSPDYKRVYQDFGHIFSKLLFESTSDVKIKFTGNFARTSYLLRENDANSYQTRIINDVRVRLRKSSLLSNKEKEYYLSRDFEALQTFVSLIYHVPVPDNIKSLFAEDNYDKELNTRHSDYYRLIVDSFDDKYICGQIDAEGMPEIKLSYAGGTYSFDHSYIRHFLYKGAQLNIINPVEKENTFYADLIIFEPDVLIDVTAIASCFQDYGITPLINVLNKFKIVDNTTAIELGNLAGQFLDEEVNYNPEANTFAESIRNFYYHNALSLITSDVESDSKNFLSQARQQKKNIHEAVRTVLPNTIGKFNPKEIILEPSFVSEMLGLQGRMDFLQLDKKVVIEQKSGRCGFPQHNPDTPVSKLQHYVQVLLYMLVLRYNYNEEYRKNHGIQAFLMYSRYANSLIAIDFAPSIMFQSVQLRNMLAYYEERCARDGFEFLDKVHPGDFITNPSKAKFFSTYIEPSVKAVLSPIHNSTTLERLYFYRFTKFVSEEHLLSKIGNRTKANSGFSSAWNDSLEEKLQAGNIYSGLTLGEIPVTDDKIETVTLYFEDKTNNDMSNFRKGDIVMLYPYSEDTEPDARKVIIFRCSIAEIYADKITLKLRAPQSDANVFVYNNYHRWAVEHDFMESSYSPLYRGLHSLLTVSKDRRDLILSQRLPKVNKNKTLSGDYASFNDLMLKVKQADDLFLILGPPGSGKTSFGMLNTLKEHLLDPDTSVLLLSYTNRAVDEICSKLLDSGIDFVRIGSKLSCAECYHDYLISERVRHYPRLADMREMLQNTRVFAGTVTALNGNLSLFKIKTFTLAIIDEASQILEPHLMPLLCAANATGCAIKKFVMIGDHKQLPAVVQQTSDESAVKSPELNNIGITDCRNSLFQRLYETYGSNPDVTYMLTRQGRMHCDIAAFSNSYFYNDKLKTVPLEHQKRVLPTTTSGTNGIDDILTTRRIAFIASEQPVNQIADKINQNEADIISSLIYHIYDLDRDSFDAFKTVGVIVPYRNQISTIRNTLIKTYNIPNIQDITIDTVERFQGSQRTYIIYGFTITKYYQLSFLTSTNFIDSDGLEIDRKLNVAMTRAMEHLIIVGNPYLMSNNFTYSKLIEFIKLQQGYFEIPLNKFINGNFKVASYSENVPDYSTAEYALSKLFDRAFHEVVLNNKPSTLLNGTDRDIKYFAYPGYKRNCRDLTQTSAYIYSVYSSRMQYCIASETYRSISNIISEFSNITYIDFTFRMAECAFAFIENSPSINKLISLNSSGPLYKKGISMLSYITDVYVDSADYLSDIIFTSSSAYVINMSGLFSQLTPLYSEHIANYLLSVIKANTYNDFVIVVQSSLTESRLNSYNVFKSILLTLNPYFTTVSKSVTYLNKDTAFEYPFVSDVLLFRHRQ